jgi:hypothetical protein
MFSGNMRFLLASGAVILLLWLVSKFKVFVLVFSWLVILFCVFVLYVKTHGGNERLKARLDGLFAAFRKSGFFRFASSLLNPRGPDDKDEHSG